MNDQRLGHEHFTGAFSGQQLVRGGHDSDWRLHAEPKGKQKYDQRCDRKRAPSLNIGNGSFKRRPMENVNSHVRSTPIHGKNNLCKLPRIIAIFGLALAFRKHHRVLPAQHLQVTE